MAQLVLCQERDIEFVVISMEERTKEELEEEYSCTVKDIIYLFTTFDVHLRSWPTDRILREDR